MVRINQEDIDRFVSVTKLSSSIAIQKLKEHHGNIDDALDAFYIEAGKSMTQDTISAAPRNDVMGVDDPQSLKEVPMEAKGRIGVSGRSGTRASTAINVPDETDDIENDMIRAAIEASKEDMDTDLALALSLSLQTVEEKAMIDLKESAEASEQENIEELPS